MNMRIAICEDNDLDSDALRQLICECQDNINVDLFISADLLMEAYSHGKQYDLIFMDIQLPGINGFDAAKKIYHEYYEMRPIIIFITITDKYVFDAYNVGWAYICKPIEKDMFFSLYNKVLLELSHRKIQIKISNGAIYLESRDILYFEAFYGEVLIATTQGEYTSRLALANLLDLLVNRSFCQTHRCYVVNLRHVKKHSKNEVLMANGKTVPLSRNQRKIFANNLADFHRGVFYG